MTALEMKLRHAAVQFENMGSMPAVVALLKEAANKVAELQYACEMYEGMKEGVAIRMADLERQLKEQKGG